MDFSNSTHLTCIPDLSQAPNLESLILEGCTSLTEIPSSIQHLVKLVTLDLTECKNLRKFPASSDSIKELYLSGCSKLKAFPISSSVEVLGLSGTAVEVLSSNFERLSRLSSLVLDGYSRLTCLPDCIGRLTSLAELNIYGCPKPDRLPEELGNSENLEILDAEGVPIEKIPSSMSRSKNLGSFKCQEQPSLQLPPFLEVPNLCYCYLDNCHLTELPESLGLLSSLESLALSGNNMESIPESIINLSRLGLLDLNCCERLQSLPELPRSLSRLYAANCKSLQALPNFSTLPANLTINHKELTFISCFNLNRNAIRDLVKNVLLKILSKECARNNVSGRGSCMNFPGDEIPKWFTDQHLESFILFKLPPDGFNDAFFGFALCIVVAFCCHRDNHCGVDAKFDCEVKLLDGEPFLLINDGYIGGWYATTWYNGPSYIKGDHVFLKFFELQRDDFCGENFSDEISFRFYLTKRASTDPINCCKVKKCGVRLMYKQDFVDSNESFNFDDNCFWKSTKESSSSRRLFEEEEQKEPDPKRLKLVELL